MRLASGSEDYKNELDEGKFHSFTAHLRKFSISSATSGLKIGVFLSELVEGLDHAGQVIEEGLDDFGNRRIVLRSPNARLAVGSVRYSDRDVFRYSCHFSKLDVREGGHDGSLRVGTCKNCALLEGNFLQSEFGWDSGLLSERQLIGER